MASSPSGEQLVEVQPTRSSAKEALSTAPEHSGIYRVKVKKSSELMVEVNRLSAFNSALALS
jgi:hypothetical protein